eukprot:NODE_100_length_20331_cov_1.214462.p12 type:complete len:296 gc:universal NODE_100_length_20331_cov_1.214462:7485-8372(+)
MFDERGFQMSSEKQSQYTTPTNVKDIQAALTHAEDILDEEDEVMDPDSLINSIYEVNEMHNRTRYKNISTEVMNARLFSKIASAASAGISQLKIGDTEISAKELVTLFIANKAAFGKALSFKRQHVPIPTFHNVLLEKNVEPPSSTKKLTQPPKMLTQELDKLGKESKADSLTDTNFYKESSHYVKAVKKCLKENASEYPISIFKFAFHPTLYNRTVENLYYLTFLMRDGVCELIDESKDCLVKFNPDGKANKDQFRQGFKRHSFILSLTKETWEAIVLKYRIESCIIPTDLDDQ